MKPRCLVEYLQIFPMSLKPSPSTLNFGKAGRCSETSIKTFTTPNGVASDDEVTAFKNSSLAFV
jgi:hypothetical protein